MKNFHYNYIYFNINYLECCSLPKLRKENLYVENDLNTLHQQHMYDFIYDQQDIYDYYDEIFEQKNKTLSCSVNVRQPHLPLASTLENIDDIISEFYDEKDMLALANIRWYISQYSLDQNNEK